MFRKYHKRSHFLPFVIFRLLLSLAMFVLLFGGLYLATKSFSGVDPLKMDLNTITTNLKSINITGFAKYIPFDAFKKSGKTNEDVLTNLKTGGQSDSLGKVASQNSKPLFNFVLIADSHSDNSHLKKALTMIKKFGDAQFLIGLGDYTEVGTVDELKNAKIELDAAGIRYFLTPGDHDLWDSRDKSKGPSTNFNQVFGPSYQTFHQSNFKFVILYNSDNYIGVDQQQMEWLRRELSNAKEEDLNILIFLHTPLFHPSSDHVMGRVEPKLKDQARELNKLFADSGVKKVFAGDTHIFSEYVESETNLSMVTVGAVTSERNLQLPRFSRVWVYEDGEVKVEDVEIK